LGGGAQAKGHQNEWCEPELKHESPYGVRNA
jgi:hypothetical protein